MHHDRFAWLKDTAAKGRFRRRKLAHAGCMHGDDYSFLVKQAANQPLRCEYYGSIPLSCGLAICVGCFSGYTIVMWLIDSLESSNPSLDPISATPSAFAKKGMNQIINVLQNEQ